MKKIFALISVVALFTLAGCQKSFLDTNPSDRVSGTSIYENAENALTAVNGIFRLMYTGGWGSAWEAENGGLPAYILTMDVKAEDHVMDDMGSGWFYYDYMYDTFGDYSSNAGHQYNIWNFFYTLISNANYILANEEMEGDKDYLHYVLGEAYAVRSFAYMWLIQTFQQNGGPAGSEYRQLPGVPLYTQPTVAGSEGKGRGTVQDVYEQANKDINSAIEHLKATSIVQLHKSHISLAAAYGLKARHALVQHDYPTALSAAKSAIEEAKKMGQENGSWDDIKVINDVSKKNVMWGLAIQTDQAIGGWDIFNHMDADCLSQYSQARHLIGSWLYNQIPDTDVRKAWWTAPLDEDDWGTAGEANGSQRSYCQKKLVYIDATASTGDHVLMRTEEMYLIAAEAACEGKNYTEARSYLKELEALRDPDYETRLASFADAATLNPNTTGSLNSLMDEIYFQRRVELWSENPRLFDIQRRSLAFTRNWAGTNHVEVVDAFTSTPRSANFILWIPQAEFDGNENMNAKTDQNPEQGRNK